nr:response regulator [Terriglobus roseus]
MRKQTVLVVNDNESHCLLLMKMLAGDTYEATYTLTGADGLQMARKLSPDVVLLDLRMPDIGGGNVCAEIRKDPNLDLTAVVFHTAFPFEVGERSGEPFGVADAFLTYPIEARDLQFVLMGCVAKRRSRILNVEHARRT